MWRITKLNVVVSWTVSLDGILQDIRSLERGMEMAKKEFLVQDDSSVLKEFIKTNSEQLETLIKDSKKAQVSLQSISNVQPTPHYMLSDMISSSCLLCRRHTDLWWSISERILKPRSLPCFSRRLDA